MREKVFDNKWQAFAYYNKVRANKNVTFCGMGFNCTIGRFVVNWKYN